MKFAFFGTPQIAVTALTTLADSGFKPSLVITNPDAIAGRKQLLTPPPVKIWAEENKIAVLQPQNFKDKNILSPLLDETWDIFVVLAYGKLLPEWLIELPKYQTINAHPSLLPKLRGASPIRSALLSDLSAVGVSIIQLDAELDHGPILKQQALTLNAPILGQELDTKLGEIAGKLLAEVMEKLPSQEITPIDQDHSQATFCTKITKDMSELELDPYALPDGETAQEIYRRICAFDGWPETFFIHEGKRIKIKSAQINTHGQLEILRITPEGKKEMDWASYFR